MRNVSDKSCRENQNTHFVFCNFFFFRKSCRLWDNVGKYCRAGLATDDNRGHALCMADNNLYRHTLRICNIYSFFLRQQWLLQGASLLRLYVRCLFLSGYFRHTRHTYNLLCTAYINLEWRLRPLIGDKTVWWCCGDIRLSDQHITSRWHAIPACFARDLDATRGWLWWEFIVLMFGGGPVGGTTTQKTDSVKETKDWCIKFAPLFSSESRSLLGFKIHKHFCFS